MKKILSVIIIVFGIIAASFGIHWKMKESASIAIIGGADGPTSVFIAGKVGDGMAWGTLILGVVLIIAGIVIYKIIRKK